MTDDISEVLLPAEAIHKRVEELGRAITEDYRGKKLMLIGVLKGAVIFLMDLARAIDLPLEIDFMAVSSYGPSTDTSGVVRILKDLDSTIEDKEILIVEDIVDTGLTLKYISEYLLSRSPLSLKVCALLNKAKERKANVRLDNVGFEIPDRYVVGYGLDYAEMYRNLPYIAFLKADGPRVN